MAKAQNKVLCKQNSILYNIYYHLNRIGRNSRDIEKQGYGGYLLDFEWLLEPVERLLHLIYIRKNVALVSCEMRIC